MTPVNRSPAILVLLALALLLAPLGICFSGPPAMAAAPHASGMHHASALSAPHSDHGKAGRIHFCPECQPPSFVKAGKTFAPDIAPVAVAVVPVAAAAPFTFAPVRSTWVRGLSSRPPPLRRTYRIRLQI
jgi:hypothetical protein